VCSGGWNVSAPTDNHSNTYTQAALYNGGTVRPYSGVWYCHLPTTGTSHTITTTNNAQVTVVLAFSGSIASGSPLDQAASGYVLQTTSATVFPTSSVTPGSGNELILCTWGIDDPAEAAGYSGFTFNNGFTAGPGQDEVAGNYFGCATAYLYQSAAAAISCSLTRATALTQTGQSFAIVSFKGVAGGGTAYSLSAAQGSLALGPVSLPTFTHGRPLAASQGSLALTGKTATLVKAHAYPLAASVGSLALLGVALPTFTHGRPLSAGQGTLTLTPKTVTTSWARSWALGQGSLALAPKTVVTSWARSWALGQGSLHLTAEAATLTYSAAGHTNYSLAANNGNLALSLKTITTSWARHWAVVQGSLALTPKTVTTSWARSWGLSQGSLALTDKTATLSRAKTLSAGQGSLTLTGEVLTVFAHNRSLAASQGSLALTGETATLVKSHGYALAASQGSLALASKTVTYNRGRMLATTTNYLSPHITGKTATLAWSAHPIAVQVATQGYTPRTLPIIPGGEAKYLQTELANVAKAIKAANAAIHTVNAKI